MPELSNETQDMTNTKSISFALFGKAVRRKHAVALAMWAGNAFFGAAAMPAFFLLLTMFRPLPLVGIYVTLTIVFATCGYFTRYKLSRSAAIIGVFFSVCCLFFPWLFPGGNSGFLLAFTIWLGIRGIEATFKLRGRFSYEAMG